MIKQFFGFIRYDENALLGSCIGADVRIMRNSICLNRLFFVNIVHDRTDSSRSDVDPHRKLSVGFVFRFFLVFGEFFRCFKVVNISFFGYYLANAVFFGIYSAFLQYFGLALIHHFIDIHNSEKQQFNIRYRNARASQKFYFFQRVYVFVRIISVTVIIS